jgi:hypothetical protein
MIVGAVFDYTARMKLIVALGVLLAPLAGAGAQGACLFSAPTGWNQTTTRWEGECRDGHADGLGVLKEYQQQKVVRFFFGRLEHGEVKLGVIDQPEGFVAGEFVKGAPVPSEDAQRTVSAFAEAEKAANEAASRFSKAGNKESAKLYAAKAKELREQLD